MNDRWVQHQSCRTHIDVLDVQNTITCISLTSTFVFAARLQDATLRWTVLAPNNAAFQAANLGTLSATQLANTLNFNFIPGQVLQVRPSITLCCLWNKVARSRYFGYIYRSSVLPTLLQESKCCPDTSMHCKSHFNTYAVPLTKPKCSIALANLVNHSLILDIFSRCMYFICFIGCGSSA